ncbi:phage portal protein [Streptomyces sp. 891-h]|uniref:phage portal protein n=1 Tax=Streptomyces sp. 891-h TaxID=2720714 RepID=UPI001FA9D36B|nr:phage portal protein [Streptomyces sp. 891-h]UNZ18878.1 phage portal protein [Streptomyces sp. 891-h]
MPLPETGAPWPPPQMAPFYEQMRVNDAWYSGDKDRLSRVYGNSARPAERRRLWGRKRAQEQHRGRPDNRLHVPFPGDIARTSADLLFADMPRISIPDADTATADRLAQLITEGHLSRTLISGAEQAAGLSGVYLRATWDREVTDRPILTVEQPDAAVPVHRFGMLREVTFWRELPGSTTQTVWRHLELHEPGHIRHALYEGTPDNLGRAVPLTAHPDTAELVTSLDPDGDGQTIATGIKDLTAAYVPNMLPNRLHRGSPMGRSDYAAPLYDLFDSLDETWTSWMRDLRLGRARLLVSAGYLRNDGPGNGATFDDDREVFTELNISPTDERTSGITESQFEIRTEQHQRTADSLIRQAAMGAGYSPESFGLEGGAVMTATEVDDNKALSMVTRKKKTGYWADPLADMLYVMLQLDVAQFGQRITPARPTVEFGTGVVPSPERTAQTVEMLSRAEAISTETKVRMAHPEWDKTAVETEVTRILSERDAPAADPVGTFPM